MDTRLKHQTLIKDILNEYAKYKPAFGEIDSRVSFDDEHGTYALLQVGWNRDEYVHGAVIHVDLIEDKIWVQYDGTEEGIATDLVENGVPTDTIVLGFRSPAVRPYTGFAVA